MEWEAYSPINAINMVQEVQGEEWTSWNEFPRSKTHKRQFAYQCRNRHSDSFSVAKRLGHTKPTTTTSIYSHFLRRPDREAAEKLDNLFSYKKDKLVKQKRA